MPASLENLKYPGPPIIVKQPESQTVQARANVTLSVVASSGVKATYQWFQEPSDAPGGLIWGANAPAYSPPNLKKDTAFWVTVHNSAGAVTSDRAMVLVHDGHRPRLGIQVIRSTQDVVIIIDGKSGATYDIQFAENLAEPVRWWNMRRVTADQEVDWFYLKYDPEQPSRFYRAIELP
jgi:FAD/FMN-containing dehydrogenase